ncbi:MAG TPA: LptA/OstA family protein [Acetobacteraceae bacterium]|nr:LptA/OstA family protein [Acetobacteraceae bacterium]
MKGGRRHAALSGVFGAALSCLAVASAGAQGIDFSHGGPVAISSRDGIEWLQQEHKVIATGDARAVRQNVTVTADRLIAFYRKKAEGAAPAPPGAAPPATKAAAGPLDVTGADEGGNEIYRLEAEGHVVITTPTDRAQGDKAMYDLDRAVMVMTGGDLRLTTPNDVLTARDDLEYWSAKHMAVARGNAVVLTKDQRRIAADVLVAYTSGQSDARGQPDGTPQHVSQADDDPLGATGKLQKVEAFGHVVVSTPTDVVTGGRGVYVPETGIAVLVDRVRITRGQNQLEGSEAEVNLKTGISRLIAAPRGRVEGLIVPNETQGPAPANPASKATPGHAPGGKR